MLLEAMATGAAIVCSDIEGYRAVAHPEGAVLVPPPQLRGARERNEQLAAAPARRREMSATNLEHVRMYDWAHVATRVREEYLVAMEKRALRSKRTLAPLPRSRRPLTARLHDRSARKTWARHASRWVPVLLVAAGCVYLARTVDVAQLKASLLTVDVWPLALSVLFAALGVVAHSAYWRVLLRTVAPVTLREMVIYSFASYATNVFPMRPGEALRVWLVQKRHGVPVVFGAATIALEKIADVLSLLILVSPLPWLIADLPPSVAKALRILPCIVVAAIVAVVIASRHALRWNVLSGFRVVHRPGVIAAGFACIFLAWLCDVSAVLSTLVAVHIAPTMRRRSSSSSR